MDSSGHLLSCVLVTTLISVMEYLTAGATGKAGYFGPWSQDSGWLRRLTLLPDSGKAAGFTFWFLPFVQDLGPQDGAAHTQGTSPPSCSFWKHRCVQRCVSTVISNPVELLVQGKQHGIIVCINVQCCEYKYVHIFEGF